MKVCGIIAEYNPFHNGHLYQIEKIRSTLKADYIVAVMSGDFVQRGAPAIMEARKRAEAALLSGIDLVAVLPVSASTASAEGFAAAGVRLMNALGVIDYLSFGCESPDIKAFESCAAALINESEDYRSVLRSRLKEGLSFPSARILALNAVLPGQNIQELLSSPNNILACEYFKALLRTGSRIRPFPVLRCGSSYHCEMTAEETFPSAAALRSLLLSEKNVSEIQNTLIRLAPPASAGFLLGQLDKKAFLTTGDLDSLLCYQLLRETDETITRYADVTQSLGNRILNSRNLFRSFESFCDVLKTKEITRSHISRALLHILLDIRQENAPSFIRILGFRKDCAPLLQQIKAKASLPLVTRPARDLQLLSESAKCELRQDLFAAELYESLLSMKENRPRKSEYEKQLVIL